MVMDVQAGLETVIATAIVATAAILFSTQDFDISIFESRTSLLHPFTRLPPFCRNADCKCPHSLRLRFATQHNPAGMLHRLAAWSCCPSSLHPHIMPDDDARADDVIAV